MEYGAGISHIGLSPNGNIHNNQIYYNESVDSGGGIAIESELPVGAASLGDGTGRGLCRDLRGCMRTRLWLEILEPFLELLSVPLQD